MTGRCGRTPSSCALGGRIVAIIPPIRSRPPGAILARVAEQPDEDASTPINHTLSRRNFRRVREMAKLSDRLAPHSMRRIFASFHIDVELQPEAAPAADQNVREVVEL